MEAYDRSRLSIALIVREKTERPSLRESRLSPHERRDRETARVKTANDRCTRQLRI